MRGWTGTNGRHQRAQQIVPVCAGVDRCTLRSGAETCNRPRVCGGGPEIGPVHRQCRGSSPCVRGWTVCDRHVGGQPVIVPVCAGVDRNFWTNLPRSLHRPRVCGGGPQFPEWPARTIASSPCVRGWTEHAEFRLSKTEIVPVCAGVDRQRRSRRTPDRDRPRVCGGGPHFRRPRSCRSASSPCVRGWTVHQAGHAPAWAHRPRVCGGGPQYIFVGEQCLGSSPCVRGWTADI